RQHATAEDVLGAAGVILEGGTGRLQDGAVIGEGASDEADADGAPAGDGGIGRGRIAGDVVEPLVGGGEAVGEDAVAVEIDADGDLHVLDALGDGLADGGAVAVGIHPEHGGAVGGVGDVEAGDLAAQ